MEEAQSVQQDHVTVLLSRRILMTIVHLIGATLTLEKLISLPSLAPSEDSSETYIKLDHPQMVSKKSKKLPPSAHYKQRYINKNFDSPLPGGSGSKSSAQRDDLQNKFFSLMLKQALRIRNEYHHKLKTKLHDGTLFAHLWEYVPVALEKLEIRSRIMSSYEMAMEGQTSSMFWLEHENISRQIRNAMRSSAEKWNENRIPELHAASRRGGLANKYINVSAYLETLGMSYAAAGRVLGWDYRTVKAMRHHFEAMTREQLLELVEQEDNPDGHELPQPHPSITEASSLRGGSREEAESRSVGLAPDDLSGSDGSAGDSGSTSRLDEGYGVAEYHGVIFHGHLPF